MCDLSAGYDQVDILHKQAVSPHRATKVINIPQLTVPYLGSRNCVYDIVTGICEMRYR